MQHLLKSFVACEHQINQFPAESDDCKEISHEEDTASERTGRIPVETTGLFMKWSNCNLSVLHIKYIKQLNNRFVESIA